MGREGLSDAVPWTDETERQFQVAEEAGCRIAARYHDAGFAVALDHCRNLARMDALLEAELPARRVERVLLLPSLEETLRRNRERHNKPFDPMVLEAVIRFTHREFSAADTRGWWVVDSTRMSAEEVTEKLVQDINRRNS